MKLAIQTHRHSGRIVTCCKRRVCWQMAGARIRAADRSRRETTDIVRGDVTVSNYEALLSVSCWRRNTPN